MVINYRIFDFVRIAIEHNIFLSTSCFYLFIFALARISRSQESMTPRSDTDWSIETDLRFEQFRCIRKYKMKNSLCDAQLFSVIDGLAIARR